MQKISGLRRSNAKAVALALMIGFISSCASQQTDELPAEATSEAALLDESETATPVADESAIFADLNGQPADSDTVSADADFSAQETSNSDAPFYNPVGGESLGRVAYTLYGDRKRASALIGQNPALSSVKSLSANQRVYFDFAQARPMPTFLTKDLLERYPTELASKIEETNGLGKGSVTLGRGETLQALSMRLYGTTRYWTEIYLLNREAIANYDKVAAGVTLSVYQRVAIGSSQPELGVGGVPVTATQTVERPAPRVEELREAVSPAQVPQDPIPETPDFSSVQPSEVGQVPPPRLEEPAKVEAAPSKSFLDLNNSASLRRAIYIVLILLIGCVAFYMTRSPKKNFDMLDVTSDTTGGRTKLKDSDTHHQEIG